MLAIKILGGEKGQVSPGEQVMERQETQPGALAQFTEGDT